MPVMLIHDGILLEETDAEKIELAKEIMRAAGRDVCDGFEIGVDVDQMLVGGARYRDKRPMARRCGRRSWRRCEAVGALPEGDVMTDYVYSPTLKKRIAVKTLNPAGKPSKRRQREAELFIKVPLRLVEMSREVSGTAACLVLILLAHIIGQPVAQPSLCPNGLMERYGINRKMKYRALAELEAAGFITVQGPLRKAPTVTLLDL